MRTATGKEWAKWNQFGATKPVTQHQLDDFVKAGSRVVGTRWVLTKKASGEFKVRRRRRQRRWA